MSRNRVKGLTILLALSFAPAAAQAVETATPQQGLALARDAAASARPA